MIAHHNPDGPARRAIRINAVLEQTGLSRTHVYRLINAGKFPKPAKLSDRLSAWDAAEIDAWLAAKFSAAKA
jgi:prophage regulatory protein